MIRVPCEQGSVEWSKARSGIPTASAFHRIITPATGRLSAQATGYIHELVAERILGVSMDQVVSEWAERGREMEESARTYYETQRDIDVDRVGFCLRDDRRAGCSPDGLVGDDGGLEIKCPSAPVHVSYVLGEAGAKYRCQIQGSLWVTGREWWDFLSYNPAMRSIVVRFERDEEFIEKLASAVDEFTERLDKAMAEMVEKGYAAQETAVVPF